MNDSQRWYAVPSYKGKSQHGEIRDPHVLDASGQLVCVCEGLDIAERIAEDHNTMRHWQGMPDNIGYKVDGDTTPSGFIREHILRTEPGQPEWPYGNVSMPPECPPLPDGAVYAGRLGDYPEGTKLPGWIWYPRRGAEWGYSSAWPCNGEKNSTRFWHYAKPENFELGDKS